MIAVNQLCYRIDGRMILKRLDMRVAKSETYAVMGLSGVGKSTLLKCISGLVTPTSGEISIQGRDIVGLSESQLMSVRSQMGMVFQHAALFDSLNVYDNVAFGLRRHTQMTEADIAMTVAEKLALVGLPDKEWYMPSQLSGGMQKRVGLARALALDPPILLYDEPTSGLDPITAANIGELIVRMRDQLGVTSVVVSHDTTLIRNVANRIGMLHQGKIVASGTREEMNDTQDPLVRQFLEGSVEGPVRLS